MNEHTNNQSNDNNDIPLEKRQGSGGGGGRPINEDYPNSPYTDFERRGQNHEHPTPDKDDFQFLFGDND